MNNALKHTRKRVGIELRRPGYVFLSADPSRLAKFASNAAASSGHGSGPVRTKDYRPNDAFANPFDDEKRGFDVVDDVNTIRRAFPFVTDKVACMMHVRRAGLVNVPKLGMGLVSLSRCSFFWRSFSPF